MDQEIGPKGQVDRSPSPRRRTRGVVVIYVVLIMVALFGFVSFGVEIGRVRTAKAQLSTAADGAALAAAPVMAVPAVPDYDTARARAVAVAQANHCENTAIAMVPGEDVEFGVYRLNSRTFTPQGQFEPNGNEVGFNECNAVRVYTRRIASRGNPINLSFARVLGHDSHDVWATATAFVRGGRRGAGIVGIDWVEMNGTTYVDSYSSEPYDPLNHNNNGHVASNGDITMVGTSDIWGDARPGVDGSLDATPNTGVHGWAAPLDEPLVYPPVTVPDGVTNSGVLRINAHDVVTLPAGTYWFTEIIMRSGGTLIVEPQVKIYVTGDIDLAGGTVTNPGAPSDLEIYNVGGGVVELGGSGTLKAHVYAPEADVRLHGTGSYGFFGWVVGLTLDVQGNVQIHYDETLDESDAPVRTMLVR